jgi:hypothetical protein
MTRPIDPTTDGDAVGYLRHQAFLSSQNGRERALSDKCADYLRDMVKLVNKQIEYIRQLESDYAAKCDELRAMASVSKTQDVEQNQRTPSPSGEVCGSPDDRPELLGSRSVTPGHATSGVDPTQVAGAVPAGGFGPREREESSGGVGLAPKRGYSLSEGLPSRHQAGERDPRPSEACRCGRLGAVGYVPCPVHDRECASGGHRASKGVSQADYGLTCIESQSELDESAHVLGLTNSRRCPNEAPPSIAALKARLLLAEQEVRNRTDKAKPEGCNQPCAWFESGAARMVAYGETVRVLNSGDLSALDRMLEKARTDHRSETARPTIDEVRELILDKVAAITRSFSPDDPWIQAMLSVLEAIDEKWPSVTGSTGT